MAVQRIPILVSMEAKISVDGTREEPMRLMTGGEMFCQKDARLIRYEETLETTELPTQIEMTFSEGVITMARKGDYETNMVFEKGKRYETQYTTPYGVMDMAVYCLRALYKFDAEGGEVSLKYQLDLNGEFAAMHTMNMHFMVKKAAK